MSYLLEVSRYMLCSHGVIGEVTATTDAPSWTTGHDMRTCFEVLVWNQGSIHRILFKMVLASQTSLSFELADTVLRNGRGI